MNKIASELKALTQYFLFWLIICFIDRLLFISAFYDKLDVTDILNSMISDDKLDIQVTNQLFTDPNYGVVKELNVNYEYNNEIKFNTY